MNALHNHIIRKIASHLNLRSLHQFSMTGRAGRNATKNFKFAAMPLPKRVAYLRDEIAKSFAAHSIRFGSLLDQFSATHSQDLQHQILSFIGSTHKQQLRKYIDIEAAVSWGGAFNVNRMVYVYRNKKRSISQSEWEKLNSNDWKRLFNGTNGLPQATVNAMDNLLRVIDTDPIRKERNILKRIRLYLSSVSLRPLVTLSRKVYLYLAAAKARHIVKHGLLSTTNVGTWRRMVYDHERLSTQEGTYIDEDNRDDILRGENMYSTLEVHVVMPRLHDVTDMPDILANCNYSVKLRFPMFKSLIR